MPTAFRGNPHFYEDADQPEGLAFGTTGTAQPVDAVSQLYQPLTTKQSAVWELRTA